MSNYSFLDSRHRNKTLLVVEGKHEKETFMLMLITFFPEISINKDDIYVYGTDIYDLYEKISEEYGNDWAKEGADIDIPYVLKKYGKTDENLRKRDFSNILLFFDYEHHDNLYSDSKIMDMQAHFNDMSGDGLLYVNYPMMEAYKHFIGIPDDDFINRKIKLSDCNPGRVYKETVKNISVVAPYICYQEKLLKKIFNYGNNNEETINTMRLVLQCGCCEEDREAICNLLQESGLNKMQADEKYYSIVSGAKRLERPDDETTLFDLIRRIIIYIAGVNIIKALFIQNGTLLPLSKETYNTVDWERVLKVQNQVSVGQNGFIWVLSSCVTMLAEYKFFWNGN